jgi:hypothetical protein
MNSDNEQPPVADAGVVLQFPESATIRIQPPLLDGRAVVRSGDQSTSGTPITQEDSSVVNIRGGVGNIFYDPNRGGYQIPNDRGGWVLVNEGSVQRELKLRGYSAKPAGPDMPSPMEMALNVIQRSQDLSFSGSLAGYPVGLHLDGPRRLLVTDEAQLIKPAPGEWPFLRRLFTEMFDSDGHRQSPYFFGWLKVAFESLSAEKRRPGQAVVFAGPHDAGKSLVQGQVVTPILGGREARPYRYMRGGSEFNADLFAAEHLILEDETPSTDLRTRKALGSRIKEITVNATQSCHPKGRNAITLSPFWRLTISLNEETENLMVLPPIEPSLEDKIILFRVSRPNLPQTQTEEERESLRRLIAGELPGFLDWLVNWQIPPELASGRFGITHWHHPELLHSLAALSPEVRLLELIDSAEQAFWPDIGKPWLGSAEILERTLMAQSSPVQRQAEKLFSFSRACATYLGRLSDSHRSRVRQRRTRERNLWEILPPQGGEVDGDLEVGEEYQQCR